MAEPEPQQSRLLSLPGEIRNRIYRLVAVHREPVHLTGSAEPTDHNINFSPRLPGLALACQKTYDEIKRIYYEENTFNFTEYALRLERLTTFRLRAAQSASKVTVIKITRALGLGFFSCKLQFTIRLMDYGISLSEFSDEFVNTPRPLLLPNQGVNGVNGICHCLVDKLVAKASKSALPLLDFVERCLFLDGKLEGDRAMQLGLCSRCDKLVMVSSDLAGWAD